MRLRAALAAAALILGAIPAHAQQPDPIGFVGHGAFFDADGQQVAPTPAFVARAQAFYRGKLLAALPADKQAQFSRFQQQLTEATRASGQNKLVVDQRALDWLAGNVDRARVDAETIGKIGALRFVLQFQLPSSADPKDFRDRRDFQLDPAVQRQLDLPAFKLGGFPQVFLATINSGQAYINECVANQVPIPPSIGVLDPAGTSGWRSLGFLPTANQFITGTPAELRTFVSPQGMCFALPRYTNASLSTVMLDGVICLSKITSKVCFWDNQMNGTTFKFPTGTKIPIGVASASVDAQGRYQAGGKEIENNPGAGVCTNCHAGQNPYIIHSDLELLKADGTGSGVSMGDLRFAPLDLPTFSPSRYDPLVAASWPQNDKSMSLPLVPSACSGCHRAGGPGGAFPHLSKELKPYCDAVLANAVARTMPPGSPGSETGNQEVIDFQNWCKQPGSAGPANRGDPHLSTTADGKPITYDFQAAGEFTALRNTDAGFELQTRQTPVATANAVANGYTGLTSCVSLNTAVAARLGKRRISFQPGLERRGGRMQLRVDGAVVALPPAGLSFGGNRVTATGAGGLDISAADGTRVVVIPNFWSSQGLWYLNVEVMNAPAQEGTMAPILPGNWLPLAPNGQSFGPMPGAVADRHTLLNKKFADAWRVSPASSLFDYAAGSDTNTFTDPDWPPPPGDRCVGKLTAGQPVAKGLPLERAQSVCRPVRDVAAFATCVADVQATGEPGFAKAYQQSLDARQ